MTSYGTAWVREPAVRRREICGVYDKRDAAYDKYVPTAARTPAPPTRFAPGLVKQAASKVGVIGGTYLDPLYLPAHVRCAFSCDELAQLATVGRQLVDAETGRVAVRPGDVRLLLAAAGGPAGPARCAACVSRVGCSVEKPAGFADVIVWVATSRTAILDFTRKAARGARVQLPPCCTNAACTGVAPSCFAAKLDDLTPEQIAIYTVFCGAARDGLVAKADVARVLEAYGVDAYGKGLDSNEVDDVFNL